MNQKKKSILRRQLIVEAFGLLICVIGYMFLQAGLKAKSHEEELREVCTSETIGTLIDTTRTESRSRDHSKRTHYYGVYEYTVYGVSYTYNGKKGYTSPTVSEEIEIMYFPEDPSICVTDESGTNGFILTSIAFIVSGVGISLWALKCFASLKRKYKKEEEAELSGVYQNHNQS